MKTTAPELLTPIEPIVVSSDDAEPGLWSDLMLLTKARLSMLVLVTTFVGFCLGSPGGIDWVLLFSTLLGTGLVAASASIFNQVLERDIDLLMERTRNRPLPAGRMAAGNASLLGAALGMAGVAVLAVLVNLPTACLAVATLVIYVALYTPLKRKTSVCTLVGAVSGAIPPVIGWVAATRSLGIEPLILFGVLFFWQMPHFLAISWMYRDEYANAGFKMLSRTDSQGIATSRQSVVYALALCAVTIVPGIPALQSPAYFSGALVLGIAMLVCAMRFLRVRNRLHARQLFFASIIYLPLLLGLMVFARR